eukprot:COSAG01_NODE_30_length_36127_cov_41.433234_9_plen_96_part_00
MLDDSCQDEVSLPSGCHMGLGLEPSEQSALKAFAALPWNYKLIYGMMSDSVPIMGSHRRAYICLSGLVGVVGFVGMGTLCGDRSCFPFICVVSFD